MEKLTDQEEEIALRAIAIVREIREAESALELCAIENLSFSGLSDSTERPVVGALRKLIFELRTELSILGE